MPTTASSAASVTSPLRACTAREIGVTRCAKRHATSAMPGSGSALHRARLGSVATSTIPAPITIIALCAPCTMPQPMKYRIGYRSFVARETTWPVGCRS